MLEENLNSGLELIYGYAVEYGLNIFFALIILIVGRWMAKRIVGLIKRSMSKTKIDPMLSGFIGNIAYVLLMAFVLIAAISRLGVETTSIAAIFAAAGLAIGLALQGSLSNFASGVMIITFRPFKKGDYIEAGGIAGTVNEMSIFTTELTTPDNKIIIVPNSNITGGNITNYSAQKTRRIDLVIGCSYSDDLKKVKEVLHKVITSHEKVHAEPEPMIAVSELADSSVNFVVRPWVDTADYWAVRFELIETIKTTFDKESISIPFPQRDVHMIPIIEESQQAPKKTMKAAPKKAA